MRLRLALALLLALASPAFAQTLATPNYGCGLQINGTALGCLPLGVSKGGTGVGTLTGIIKGTGTSAFVAAVAGTDYAPATSGSAILKGNGAGGFSSTIAGTDYVAPSGSAGALDVTTQAVDNSTTKAASTAYVIGQAASVNPAANGTAAPGTSTRFARGDHVHPTDTTRAPATTGTLALKGNGAGGFANATNADLSAATASSWTPTDASGAGLTFSIAVGSYQVSGNLCYFEFNVTYPVTANSAVAKIGGLPAACNVRAGSISMAGSSGPSFTDAGIQFSMLTGSASTFQFYTNAAGAVINSQFGTTTGKTIRGSMTVPIQ